MENLTGVPDVDKLILLDLDDQSLSQAALTSTYVNSLMDESFWSSKFHNKYGVTLWKYGVSHREIYKEFSRLYGNELAKAAIHNNFIELVELLLNDNNKDELLIYASYIGEYEMVKLLLERGADIHAGDDMSLLSAAHYSNYDVIKLLLDKGADIHARDDEAVHSAIRFDLLNTVKLLLDKGADIHSRDDKALEYAIDNGNLKMVKLLLDGGVYITDKALTLAIKNDYLEIVDLLNNYYD